MVQILEGKPGLGALFGAGLGQGLQGGMQTGMNYAMQLGLQKAKQQQQMNMLNQIFGGQQPSKEEQPQMTPQDFLGKLGQARGMERIYGSEEGLPTGEQMPQELKEQMISSLFKQPEMTQQPPKTGFDYSKLSPEKKAMLAVVNPQAATAFERGSKAEKESVDRSWATHQKFIDEQSDLYREGKNTMDKLQLQKDLVKTGKLAAPPVAVLSDLFGIEPLLYNDPSQLYSKVEKDLASGFTKWLGTARTNQSEFKIFLGKFATLKNTDAGKNLILDFQMAEQKMKDLVPRITSELTDEYARSGSPLPKNFRSEVNKRVDIEERKMGLDLKGIMNRANEIDKTSPKENQINTFSSLSDISESSKPKNGDMARNKKTGEKFIFKNNKWFPVKND